MSLSAKAALAACLVLACLATVPARAGLAPDIVTGTYSGLAIRGYDPVAYFAGRAEKGRAEFTAMWRGVAWQFANRGNREAFLAAPEVYAPAFGGYCPVALGRGERTEADPRLFAVHRGRAYLFYSRDARDAFLRAPDAAVSQARRQWKTVAPQAPAELTPAGLPRQ